MPATTYTYDAENRLIAISGNGTSVLYEYYPDGLRKSKTVNGITTTYVWDGDNMVYEVTAGTGTKYLYGLDLFAKQENPLHFSLMFSLYAVSLHDTQLYYLSRSVRFFSEIADKFALNYTVFWSGL